jgi:hypothetical protein
MNRPEIVPMKLVAAAERELLKRLFGRCSHRFSLPHSDAVGRDYKICLRCGVNYEDDWAAMRRTDRLLPTDEGED